MEPCYGIIMKKITVLNGTIQSCIDAAEKLCMGRNVGKGKSVTLMSCDCNL